MNSHHLASMKLLSTFTITLPTAVTLAFPAPAQRPNILIILADDIGETKNLAAVQPEKVKELRAKLDALLKNAVPPGNANIPDAGRSKRAP